LAATTEFCDLSSSEQPEVRTPAAKCKIMSCSACGHDLLHSSTRRAAAGKVAAGAVAALITGPCNEGASAEVIDLKEGSVCIGCNGDGITQCPRCEGTGMMNYIGDPDTSHKSKCSECRKSTGWRICGKCSGTGLPQKELKVLRRDPAFVKTSQRNFYDVTLDEEGRRNLKEVLSQAIKTARERKAKSKPA